MKSNANLETYADRLAWELAEIGVKDAFVVTGGAIGPFTNSIVGQNRIKIHYLLTEQSAGIAAEAYGYSSGIPTLLIVTSGPGVTNALTPVAAGWTNSSPMIVISGQARGADVELQQNSKSRQVGNQHVRTDLLAASVVKAFIEPIELLDPKALIKRLYRESVEGRQGPTWLSLPQDIQRNKSTNFKSLQTEPAQSLLEESDTVTSVLESMLKLSNKPALLIGNGARNQIDKILHFATFNRIPVMTTWPGLDLISDEDPIFVGRPGSIPSGFTPNLVVQNCDLLVVLGARLDLAQVGFNADKFALNADVLRIDIDPEEFNRIPHREKWRNIQFDLRKLSLPSSYARSDQFLNWWKQIEDWKANTLNAGEVKQTLTDGLSTYSVYQRLGSLHQYQIVVSGSSGTCMEMFLQSWKVSKGQRVINSCGLGSMGFALAAAIGVSARFPGKRILCIESDGSLAMNLQDLQTIISLSLPITLAILNSNGYKSISLSQQRLGQIPHGSSSANGLALPNIMDQWVAMGGKGKIISSECGLNDFPDFDLDALGPQLLEFKVSAEEESFPRLISRPNAMGQMETPPFEQLSIAGSS